MPRVWSPDAVAHVPRPFETDEAVRAIGDGLLARTLPGPHWTHEAHIAATLWLIRETPDIVLERDLPGMIRGCNDSVGGVNNDTQGYHRIVIILAAERAGARPVGVAKP